MKIFFLACILTLVHIQITLAQFSDDFSDNDFTKNPSWFGDVDKFTINNVQQLALRGSTASSSFLSTPFSSTLNSVEWTFFIKQNFSPSANNYSRVYLASDNTNLNSALNGYYLQFGEAGANDAIELFRQSGANAVSVCRGKNGNIASSFQANIKVIRTADGTWRIYTDFNAGENFTLEGTATDVEYNVSSFLGVLCVYTNTNTANFFFDNFYAGPPRTDTVSPFVRSVSVISSTELDIALSERVQSIDAEDPSNYFVSGELGSPDQAVLQSDGETIKLIFKKGFPDHTTCSITIKTEKDLAGNEMASFSNTFLYSQPAVAAFKDVVLSEIFADPSPQLGLPNAEYVELLNRGENTIDLSGWKFTDGSTTGLLTSKNFPSKSYLILTSLSNLSLFSSFDNVLGISNFPTLNNDGDDLVLKDEQGLTIDSVNYSDAWYQDDDKKEGGWSLELIDPDNFCSESENWTASEDNSGGTPGRQNAVIANKPDLTGPKLLSVIVTSTNTAIIKFNEKLIKNTPSTTSFTLLPADEVANVEFSDPSLTSLTISFKNDLAPKIQYTLTAKNIYDCTGNEILEGYATAKFAQSETADSLDILVNEILFNPLPTGIDFVELYNNSTKFINLKNWSVANLNNGQIINGKQITIDDYLVPPSSYVVITENIDLVYGEYPASHEDVMIKLKSMPPFNDDEGTVVLLNDNKKIIDYLFYTKGMHSVFIKDEEGVSLERISFSSTTNDPQNWQSASAAVGFATPGYLNSSARKTDMITNEAINVDPEIFIPMTGQPDFTQIHYNFDRGSYVANVKIIDAQGHDIKQLANNEVLGTQGSFRWEGDRDNGDKARVGYYVVRFEIFDSDGTVKTFHKRVVIATKF